MKKKKLKLKSVKEIKESIKEETKNAKKKRKKKENKEQRHIGRTLLMIFITAGIGVASFVIAFTLYIIFTSPEFTEEKLYNVESSIIEWDDGTEMAKLGSENLVIKNYEDFPQVLVDALVATEDSRFFQHKGFDVARFVKATIGQVLGQSGAGGASTLTMQITKNNLTNTNDEGIDGIIRKFTDIYMAVFQIETRYTKEQIIEMYFNSGWFAGGGSNYGETTGIEQGSQYFFGKSVSDLSLPEAAMMVGMYNAPVWYNPYDYPENCNERKNTVLSLMYNHGYITEQEMLDAQSIHISTLVKPQENTAAANPYQVLIDYVKQEILDKEGIDIARGGYRVRTTFNKNIQDVINNLQNGNAVKFRDDLVQVGVAVTSVENGSIKGLGPGRHYVALGDNRATSFRRQPGSTIKPIIDYGPLVEYNNATTGQTVLDVRAGYEGSTTPMSNFDGVYRGAMILKDAFSNSRNVPALQAFQQVDPNNIKDFLNKLGIDETNYGQKDDDGNYIPDILESFSVGGLASGLTPLESSAAYGAFARGGYFIEPYSYTTVTNMETGESVEYKYEMTKAMSEATAYMITDVLLQATREAVGGSVPSNLRSSIASKSGTSNLNSKDAKEKGINSSSVTPDLWVNRYNGDYIISMWYGYDWKDITPEHYLTSGTGSGTRNQLATYLSNNILTSGHGFTKPDSVVSVTVEKDTLPTKRASEYTPDNMKYSALFKAGTEPSETSQRFAKLEDPSNGNALVLDDYITLTWEAAHAPDDLNTANIHEEFAEYFKIYKSYYPKSFATFENAYIDAYTKDNNAYVGTFGYQVYLKDENGNLTNLGWTQNNSFNYTATSGGKYEFVVKSAYSIFKTNESDGITIEATVANTEANEIEVNVTNICVPLNSTFDAKKAVTVTYNGEDVTASSTIIASSSNNIDTTKSGTFDVTYSITYNGQTVKKNGKVNVSESCPN